MPSPADDTSFEHGDADLDDIVRRGPAGAFAVAGIATLIVLTLFFAFYLFAYWPRGVVQ